MAEDMNARDTKLVQYLAEAHGKERELETSLEAHIGIATDKRYKDRLRDHLKETKQHAREVERAIKRLGGDLNGGNVVEQGAGVVQDVATKGTALAKGTLHALRGTGDEEKMLKNAKSEFADEAEEIATYTAIETLADTVGDRETATMARRILRQEERMASYLEKLIPTLTKAVARAEIPSAERPATRRSSTASRNGGRSRSKNGGGSTATRKTGTGSRKRTATAKRRTATSKRSRSTAKTGRSRQKASAKR